MSDRPSNGRVDAADWSAISSMAKDLRSAVGNAQRAQREALTVTGTAWSKDRLVKAVVGARGHLLELDIDPRVYRTPNSKALSATIVATVRSATDDAMEKVRAIMRANVPADLLNRANDRMDMLRLSQLHDADLRAELSRESDADGLR